MIIRMVVTVVIVLIVTSIICLWVYGFNSANDLSVPTKDVSKLGGTEKVLIIFPHPDDEANSLSGTVTQLEKTGIKTDWVILTKGEKGNDDARYDENLKEIRAFEAQKVAKILKVNSLVLKDYPDNGMDIFSDELVTDIRQIIKDSNPDLVITYDDSGGYGHSDHIVVSKIVTQLLNADFPNIHLWYTSTPEKLYKRLTLPEQMANNPAFKSNRKTPSFKVWVGITGLINKIKAVYAYQSQFASFVKSVPIKQIPMWFYISLTPYEYFYEVK